MATKKQKRAAAEEKHRSYMEEIRRSGLEAQRRDREKREAEARKAWQEQHDKKHHKFVDECPFCKDIKKQRAISSVAKASA